MLSRHLDRQSDGQTDVRTNMVIPTFPNTLFTGVKTHTCKIYALNCFKHKFAISFYK